MGSLHSRRVKGSEGQDSNDVYQDVDALITDLRNKNGMVHAKARQTLVAMGDQVVEPLVRALSSPKESVRWEAAKALDQIGVDWCHHADPTTVNTLVSDLGSDDGMVRVRARKALVYLGPLTVEPLIEALSNKKEWVRWEAAKTLGQIGDHTAIQALIDALEDKIFDVRWLAAQALITIGHEAIVPLLRAVIERADSFWLLEGAHHVFHDLISDDIENALQPVLAALESAEPSVEAPLAAKTALDALFRG